MSAIKKILLSIFILIVVSIIACQQAVKETVKDEPVMEKEEKAMEKIEIPKTEATATGEAAVDSVSNDLNDVNSVEKDLSSDELGDLDSGLADIQNI